MSDDLLQRLEKVTAPVGKMATAMLDARDEIIRLRKEVKDLKWDVESERRTIRIMRAGK